MVGFNYSEANYVYEPNIIQTGSFMVQTLLQRGHRGSYYHPEREWVGSNQEDATMNNQTTAMTVG